MLSLPPPIGPTTQSLFEYLSGARVDLPLPGPCHDPLADRDLQLALYVANELHYGGVDGVDDELEWDPWVSGLRTALEEPMLAQLLAECAPEARIEPARVPERIFALIAEDDSPPLARYLATRADREQFREFVIHRSAYQLKEADPHSFTIPRINGAAKSAMVEIQADEYGGGDAERMHSRLFANTMRALDLDPTPGAYVELLPAQTLATVNMITLLTMRRRWRGALVGHLAAFEITSAEPNRRYANGLRRLGLRPAGNRVLRRARRGRLRAREHRRLRLGGRSRATGAGALGTDPVRGRGAAAHRAPLRGTDPRQLHRRTQLAGRRPRQ